MIALPPQSRISSIVDANNRPLEVPVETPKRAVKASYDASRNTDEFERYWANSDSRGPNASDNRDVRHGLMWRSRYNVQNDGYTDGVVQTHANYTVRQGPRLRMETQSKAFNESVETRWERWAKSIHLRRKLWTMVNARVQDGEAFAVMVNNPLVQNRIKLDLRLIEAEQCQTTGFDSFSAETQIDGLILDDFGNVAAYLILKEHPGGEDVLNTAQFQQADIIPERFVCHWFKMRRPGQRRAVTELRSTLNVVAGSRRYREATIAAAETAADFSVWLQTQMTPETVNAAMIPFDQLPIDKRMLTTLPAGWEANQMKAEHPSSQYKDFIRQQNQEQGRPLSMPVNVTQADSSDHNFASGKLDHQPWFAQIEGDRDDCDDLVLEKVFLQWSLEASLEFGFNGTGAEWIHSWDWPVLPVADEKARSQAVNVNLSNGSTHLPEAYRARGKDFEEEIIVMAESYGVEVEDMREILLNKILGTNSPVVDEDDAAQLEDENAQQIPA